MSDSPCTGCRSTRNGRLFYAYVNHYAKQDIVTKRRARLCANCVAEILMPLIEMADDWENEQWVVIEQTAAFRTPILVHRAETPLTDGTPTPIGFDASAEAKRSAEIAILQPSQQHSSSSTRSKGRASVGARRTASTNSSA